MCSYVIELKSLLLSGRGIRIDAAVPDDYISVSRSGPSVIKRSFFIDVDGHTIKATSDHNSDIILTSMNGDYYLVTPDRKQIPVKFIRPLGHCPGTLYITVYPRCDLNCLFCNVGASGSIRSIDALIRIVNNYQALKPKSFSLTSGFTYSGEEIEVLLGFIEWLRCTYSDRDIGVSIYPRSKREIEKIYDLGACEFKLNVEVADRNLFRKLCPHKNYEYIHNMLKFAVELFGEGYVSSNIIVGFGEKPGGVYDEIDRLVKIGVVPIIRPLVVDKGNKNRLKNAVGIERSNITPDQLIKYSVYVRDRLKEHGIFYSRKTMCGACGACDLLEEIQNQSSEEQEVEMHEYRYI